MHVQGCGVGTFLLKIVKNSFTCSNIEMKISVPSSVQEFVRRVSYISSLDTAGWDLSFTCT